MRFQMEGRAPSPRPTFLAANWREGTEETTALHGCGQNSIPLTVSGFAYLRGVWSEIMRRTSIVLIVSFVFACGLLLGQKHTAATRSPVGSALDRLRAKIDVERPPDLSRTALVGRYSSTPGELRQRVVPLSGNYLYLFPDGTYLDYFWSDVPPPTIQDKGTWVVSVDVLTLTSDSDVTWNPRTERRYLLVRRRSHPNEILMVGMDRDLRYFEDHAKDDPEFMLLLTSKMRVDAFSGTDPMEVKRRLMREAWLPKFYTSK